MKLLVLMAMCSFVLLQNVAAQAPLPIYTDDRVNLFANQSFEASCHFNNPSPVYSGSYSISVTASNYGALYLSAPNFNTALYTNLSFWINGGSAGGQKVLVTGVLDGVGQINDTQTLPILAANTWVQYDISLAKLGVANQANCSGFYWQIDIPGSAPTFYVDAIQLNPAPAPALTHISINATNPVRTADARWFGINTPLWDNYFTNAETTSELNEAGFQCLRYPGGSEADQYNWVSNTTYVTNHWPLSFSMFAHVATNIGAQVVITANYGTGTPAEAAAWVSDSNVTNLYGFKYWEIGNEIYGSWETDTNVHPHDPYTYATNAQAYLQQMKAVDHTIKIGVVVSTGEDSYSNAYTLNHPATNSANGKVHYGWTPVLLSTLRQLGVTPDFAILHSYPESGSDSDPFLLQGSTWPSTAANLRGMIADYFGPGGTNIELLCTENNSDAGPAGQQSVSLVNALYYADSLRQLMQTEFNSLIWWDLRNDPPETEADGGDFDPTLYGWRMYGNLGMIHDEGPNLTNRYPAYFAAKLTQRLVRGGDTVLAATSDYSLLATAAVRRTNGALTLLAISKDSVSNLTAQIALNGFSPGATATVYSYGMDQDNAAETGTGSCDIATNSLAVTTNFYYTFPPYSLTVFSFAPVAPSLNPLPAQPGSGKFVFQLGGQPGAPYVLQTSSNLSVWTTVSTNISCTSFLNLTNPIAPGAARQFWRALWQP